MNRYGRKRRLGVVLDVEAKGPLRIMHFPGVLPGDVDMPSKGNEKNRYCALSEVCLRLL